MRLSGEKVLISLKQNVFSRFHTITPISNTVGCLRSGTVMSAMQLRVQQKQWRIKAGHFGATSPPNGCGTSLKWRPSDKNATLFSAYRSKNKDKKYSVETKQNDFVELRYLRDGL